MKTIRILPMVTLSLFAFGFGTVAACSDDDSPPGGGGSGGANNAVPAPAPLGGAGGSNGAPPAGGLGGSGGGDGAGTAGNGGAPSGASIDWESVKASPPIVSLLKTRVKHNTRCGDDPNSIMDVSRLAARLSCIETLLLPLYFSASQKCFEALACSQDDEDCAYPMQIVTESGKQAEATCLQKQDQCSGPGDSFKDGLCQFFGVVNAAAETKLQGCLSKPCGEVSDCFNKSLNGCLE